MLIAGCMWEMKTYGWEELPWSYAPGALVLGYGLVLLVTVAVSAFIGMRRGWIKEMLTAVGSLLMALILLREDSSQALLRLGQKVILVIQVFMGDGGRLDPEGMAELARQYKRAPLLNEGNAHLFFLAIFALVILLTRISSSRLLGGTSPGPLGKIMGLMMGALNGFLIALALDALLIPRIQGLLIRGFTISIDFQKQSEALTEGASPVGDYMVTLLGIFLALMVVAIFAGRRLLSNRGNSGGRSTS